jgi:hypothetical protein
MFLFERIEKTFQKIFEKCGKKFEAADIAASGGEKLKML